MMLLGARQFFERRGAPAWTNPYVTDGLVAMWDGEWNAGPGVHDANASVWNNIVDQSSFWSLYGSFEFTGKALVLHNSEQSISSAYGNMTDGQSAIFSGHASATMEVVCERSRVNGILLKTQSGGVCGFAFFVNTCFSNETQPTLSQSQNPIGQTYNFTITYRGNDVTSAYIDGSLVQLSGTRDNIGGSQAYATLGYRYVNAQYSFNGSIHAIRFYSRALTAAEIAANYAIDKARFNLP